MSCVSLPADVLSLSLHVARCSLLRLILRAARAVLPYPKDRLALCQFVNLFIRHSFAPCRAVPCAIIKGNNFTKLTRQMLRQQQQQQPPPTRIISPNSHPAKHLTIVRVNFDEFNYPSTTSCSPPSSSCSSAISLFQHVFVFAVVQ